MIETQSDGDQRAVLRLNTLLAFIAAVFSVSRSPNTDVAAVAPAPHSDEKRNWRLQNWIAAVGVVLSAAAVSAGFISARAAIGAFRAARQQTLAASQSHIVVLADDAHSIRNWVDGADQFEVRLTLINLGQGNALLNSVTCVVNWGMPDAPYPLPPFSSETEPVVTADQPGINQSQQVLKSLGTVMHQCTDFWPQNNMAVLPGDTSKPREEKYESDKRERPDRFYMRGIPIWVQGTVDYTGIDNQDTAAPFCFKISSDVSHLVRVASVPQCAGSTPATDLGSVAP